MDCLSTGCKTVLNVLYEPDKIFCMKECGDNALKLLYALDDDFVYSEYAMIPFEMKEVAVCSGTEKHIITDYEELKGWWRNEE